MLPVEFPLFFDRELPNIWRVIAGHFHTIYDIAPVRSIEMHPE